MRQQKGFKGRFSIEDIEPHFLKFVDKNPDGHWYWKAAINKKGYGVINVWVLPYKSYPKLERAHRVSYKLFVGPITDDLHILHKCDIRHCVNPDHLYQGTNEDNQRDIAERNPLIRDDVTGRFLRGSKHTGG